jgi:IS6 family transposase
MEAFAGDIIIWLVRWYCRYALSYGDLREMAQERGLFLERSTIMRWVHEYSASSKNALNSP